MFLMLPKSADAAVVFETNFDSIPDWNTSGQYNGDCGDWTGGVNHCTTSPTGFDNHYTPSGGTVESMKDGNPDHTSGVGNKAFHAIYPNAVYSGGSQLEVTFPIDYAELYVQFWSRTTATAPLWYQSTYGSNSAESAVKFFRISHFDRTGSAFQYFPEGYTSPVALLNWARSTAYPWETGHSLYRAAYRCDPQESNYDRCAGSYNDIIPVGASGADRPRNMDYPFFLTAPAPNSAGGFADGQWHKWEMRVKKNTGISQDGVWQVWYDGVMVRNDSAIQWNSQSGTSPGWNTVEFGGNMDNPGGSFANQWIAYDDIVVSTTAIPANYVIGEGTADTTAPSTTANPAGGTFTSAQNVTLTANETATIYYTTNGSTPTTSSAVYSSPINISSTTTLKFFAKDTAGNSEAVKTQTYTINIPVTYNISNVLILVTNWLKVGTVSDVNADNVVNTRDLGIMMSKWQ